MERRVAFFPETQSVLNEITRQFDFIWPSLAGIDYLQRSLNTYMLKNPSVTEEDCTQHFVSEIAFSRISFTKIFPNKSLEDFKKEQAKALLFSLFALYEGWLLSLQNTGVITSNQNKKLQFFDPSPGGHRTLNNLSVNESQMLKDAFYMHLTRRGSKYSYLEFNKQLLCYRVFKEIRNAYIHNGSKCSPALNSVIQLYLQKITSPSDINVTQLPNFVALILAIMLISICSTL
ncbi:hypothetical protein ACH6EH_19460 [Paenibacillus sp. JSM ZJ436]|uniref:hypothetical protein n=1 Tax=Paenibacillus sp. JSM ZJ436 TaxID=3376190 RepID=UPI0037BDAAE3